MVVVDGCGPRLKRDPQFGWSAIAFAVGGPARRRIDREASEVEACSDIPNTLFSGNPSQVHRAVRQPWSWRAFVRTPIARGDRLTARPSTEFGGRVLAHSQERGRPTGQAKHHRNQETTIPTISHFQLLAARGR